MSDQSDNARVGVVMLFAAWGLLLGLLTYFFHNWYAARENPNKTVQSLVLADGSHQVILKSNYQHQYMASGTLNGIKVMFLLDTGATHVVVPKSIADKAGLVQGVSQWANTAGGITEIYSTNIHHIQIGNIQLKGIKASINDSMEDGYVLLGMSALKHLHISHQKNLMVITLPK